MPPSHSGSGAPETPHQAAEPSAEPSRLASDGSALGAGPERARSGLDLPVEKRPKAAPSPRTTPLATAPLPAGSRAATSPMTRMGNMAHAFVMIVALLIEYLLVKVIGAKLRMLGMVLLVLLARGLDRLAIRVRPHYERFKRLARTASNHMVRRVMVVLIELLEPLERIIGKLLGRAQAISARAASTGVRQARAVLRPMLKALAQAVRAGLSRPALRRLVARLLQILEDAKL